ncbi:pyruvate dehydrogenase kinase [Rhodotorula toruloides]|uniref:Protein-serine/threonine kinase n=1 Tax=Rhodotorula toruloides TaxID=5286 RepID=A0A511K7C7_RHOTO|nr:pyruvate dehydrogenase kinase [Rhodotorula toruloides]
MNTLPRKSAVPAFYLNTLIESFAAKSSTPISLKHLINFGNAGRNKGEKEEAEKLIKSGNFLRTELPTRLSHRLRDLQELPLGVASHPRMAHVYDLYLEAFEGIRTFPPIKSLDDNDRFCQYMQGTLNKHRVVIPELAIGVAEASPQQLPPAALDRIMLRMLRSRISRRVITEQHIALTQQFRERQRKGKDRAVNEDEETRVGIVDTKLNAADVVKKCGELMQALGGPESEVPIVVEGATDQTFAYISEHLEFMLFELIKNATHATVSAHGSAAKDHPTLITIVHRPRDLAIRVSDQGGGIAPYGGLPPEPSDMAVNPLFPSVNASAPLSAQRLDIFSFSHMRRYYQHHAALAAAAASQAVLPLNDSASSTTFPSSDAPSDPNATGIMALRSLTQLTGTVKEQLERRHRLGDGADGQAERDLIDAQMRSGIGLPLSRMYAEYFDGGLDVYTLQGWGSDAFLRIPKFGTAT